MKRLIIVLSCTLRLLAGGEAVAQLSPERLAWNNLGKERWTKVETQVKKALDRDSLNVAARYVFSWYLFTPGSPSFSIDKASQQVAQAITHYWACNAKERER